MNAQKSRQAGYSLAEMLTVVAIIGTLALVMVPSFINYYNSNKAKSSMRSFTSDLRTARMTAITRGYQVKFTFKTAAASNLNGAPPAASDRTYNIYEGNRSSGTVTVWRPLTGTGSNPPRPQKELDPIMYFPQDSASTPQTFLDEDTTPDGWLDVIFFPDGHVGIPNNATTAIITIKTDRRVPRDQYSITISPSGRVMAN